jgi:hypothetical protein
MAGALLGNKGCRFKGYVSCELEVGIGPTPIRSSKVYKVVNQ